MRAVNLEKLLPADIPPGERVLWHGRPAPAHLWRRAYRADVVAVWFVAMTIWNYLSASASDGVMAGLVSALRTLGFGAAGLAILSGLAWASARTSFYVLTERRLIIKTGIALPLFINLPFKQIAKADVRTYADGAGDVTVGLIQGERIPYLALWPSARPLHFARPEPALRGIADARNVASMLGRALAEATGGVQTARVPERSAAPDIAAAIVSV